MSSVILTWKLHDNALMLLHGTCVCAGAEILVMVDGWWCGRGELLVHMPSVMVCRVGLHPGAMCEWPLGVDV